MTQAELIQKLKKDLKDHTLLFNPAESYYWSPKERTVYYQINDKSPVGLWTLLHEACHGILDHKSYVSDFGLVLLEVEAWDHARTLGASLGIAIDEDHIQDCLDSYRDWQYKRSLCPKCQLGGLQLHISSYRCLFCDSTWHVSAERFCRPYRRQAT
jgi:hypothetical protein